MFNKRKTLWFVIVLVILSGWLNNALATNSKKILIVANSQTPAYQLAISGFKEKLSSQANTQFKIHILSELDNKTESISAEIKITQPDLIFALGVASTKAVMQNTQQIPIISTMIVKSDFLLHAPNVSGVVLAYPLNIQFQWIKNILPDSSQVAILYNPEENNNIIKAAIGSANKKGLTVIAIPVESANQLPYALEQLSKNVQVLLAIPDRIAMSSHTAKFVLLASFRNRIPMVGLTDNWVKAGALYALSWNYTSVGEQCGGQAIEILNGKPVKRVPIGYPEKIEYTINTTIAERMKLQLPDSLLKNAKKVFK